MYHDACCVGCKVKCAYRCSKIPYTVVPCVYSCFIRQQNIRWDFSPNAGTIMMTGCLRLYDNKLRGILHSTFYFRTSHRPKNKKAAQTHDTFLQQNASRFYSRSHGTQLHRRHTHTIQIRVYHWSLYNQSVTYESTHRQMKHT